MTFTSASYFLFLPVVFLVFQVAPDRWRWLVLLAASYGFYACLGAPYLPAVLLLTTGISYTCARRMGREEGERERRRWLWLGTVACLAVLALLKYLPVIPEGFWGTNRSFTVIVSIGVSYFSFQAISYLADVYLEIEAPEHHFGRFALYLAFFPKLLQGPIERAGSLLPQLGKPYRFDYQAVRSGLLLFTWGFFKKVAVADRLALYADQVYNDLHAYTGAPLVLATYAYALQIYFDFSAYTDMARGTGRIFGIELTENFNSPYLATSIAEFWRRWHISFSRWILDYIFKPLQLWWRGWGQAGTALALVLTFLASGIWHGATWGFVVWGLLHGVYLAASTYYRPYQKRLHKSLGLEKSRLLRVWQLFVTWNLVCFAWVFFRAPDLGSAWYVVTHCLSGTGATIAGFLLSQGKWEFAVSLAVLLVAAAVGRERVMSLLNRDALLRWPAYYALLLTILVLGKFGESSFVYFKF